MNLTDKERAQIIDALGSEIMRQKKARTEWEADGNYVVVAEINSLCDDLIALQNKVRG